MLILASRSQSRQAMLAAAGVSFEAMPADIDERALDRDLGDATPAEIALALALAKALAVSADNPGRLVLGSDSLVLCERRRFDKPATRDEAAMHLTFFSGRTLELHSAAALVRDGYVIWQEADVAQLDLHVLTAAFIDDYLGHEWPAVAQCVGVFRIEGRGVQLFRSIAGSHFTVLGMPLLPMLGALRELAGPAE